MRTLTRLRSTDGAELSAADHTGALAQAAQHEPLGVQAHGAREASLVGGQARFVGLHLHDLVESAGLARSRGVRVGEQASLDRHLRAGHSLRGVLLRLAPA